MSSTEPSKKSIDRAGIALRAWWRGEPVSQVDLGAASLLVADYRESFSGPLNSITMGVRSMVKSEHAPVVVSQRLKRLATIVDKLARHDHMKVTRMQDIGGCRALLPDEATVRRVRLLRRCELERG